MKHKALVVEDDHRIVEDVEDLLYSIGHEYTWVTNLQDARKALNAEDFAYVLLDLEFPAKPDRGFPKKEHGALLLEEIQRIKGYKRLPVIIMTGYHAYCLHRSNELREMGASEFVPKPFPEEGRTLTVVIREVLDGHAPPPRNRKRRQFSGGEVILHSNRIEICGIDILLSKLMRRILGELNATRSSGAFVAYPGDELADLVGCQRGQNGIAEAIRDFRDRTTERLLEDANVKCGRFDIVQSGGPGYRFNPWIKLREPGEAVVVGEEVLETDGLSDRQQSILSALENGAEIRVATVVELLGCSPTTAKRDLATLRKRKLIRFDGPAKTGCYRLVGGRQAERRAG